MNALFHTSRLVRLMKLRNMLFLFFVNALPLISTGQCTSALQSITYNTTFTGSGNGLSSFTFPKFDGQLGTLTSIDYRTEVTLDYNFQLENGEGNTINYRVRVERDDEISGSALINPLTRTSQQVYGTYRLRANDGVPGSGDDHVAVGPVLVLNKYAVTSTVYNTADYLGAGDITVDYMSTTYSVVTGSVNYNFNGSANDTVNLSVTYYYCPQALLASDLKTFNALKEDKSVKLTWTTESEMFGRKYELQVSNNGQSYRPVATMSSRGGNNQHALYEYNYLNESNETGKLIFRIKQTDASGAVKYSALRVVDMGQVKKSSMNIYPNPSKGAAQIVFSNAVRGDWSVEVMDMSGQVAERYYFNNVLLGKVNMQAKLKKGLYIIKATNKKTREQLTDRLIIQ